MKRSMCKKLLSLMLVGLLTIPLGMTAVSAEEKAEPGSGPTLKCWTILNIESDADPRNVAFRKIVENWNATNPWGATMEVTAFSGPELHAQVAQAGAAGNTADVICAFSMNLQQYIASGGLQPMTEQAEGWLDENGEDYIFNADMLRQADGEIYSLPWETRTMTLYYRTDIYGEGYQFTSLDDLAEKAAEVTGEGKYGFVLGCGQDGDFLQQLQPILYANGAVTYDKDGKVVLNSEGAVATVEWLKKLYDIGAMDSAAVNMNIEDAFNGLRAGTIYAAIVGTHRYGAVTNSEDFGDKIATCAIPGAEEGTIAPAYNTCQTLGIGKSCKNPEIAFDFITANLTTEAGGYYYEAACMPVRKSVYDLPEVQASANFDVMSSWSEIWTTGMETFFFEPEYHADLANNYAGVVQAAILNGDDIQAGADKICEQYNSKYNS